MLWWVYAEVPGILRKLLTLVVRAVSLLAYGLSHVSLRGLVIILGLLLALSAPRNSLLDDVDRGMLQSSSIFFAPPLGVSEIAIIDVPLEEISIWQADIHSSGKLAALLSNILNSSDATIGLILQQPLDVGAGAAEAFVASISDISKQAPNDEVMKAARSLAERRMLLVDFLRDRRVVIGVERFFFAGQKPLLTSPPFSQPIPEFLYQLVWPPCNRCFSKDRAVTIARPEVAQYTVIDSPTSEQQTLLFAEDDVVYGGFLLRLLRAVNKIEPSIDLHWEKSRALDLGDTSLPLSMKGGLVPVHQLSESIAPILNHISLEEALARSAFPSVILIAAEGSANAARLAEALYSVRKGEVLHSPWWNPLLSMSLVLLITLYLGFISTRLSVRRATFVSGLLWLFILAGQIFAILSYRLWLPLALPLLWLFLGHFLLMVWVMKKRRVQALVARADDICINQAEQLLRRRKLEDALVQIKDCTVTDKLLATLYDIAEAYTEQKDYANAIRVLKGIQRKNKSFKDVDQKIKVLSTMLKSTHEEQNEHSALQKTMVLDPAQEKRRTLGRYRVDHEIGRGAMGKVFLGFDPRISRRVAIKTLSYEQFKSKERHEIKQRFYREAEAAGRLNHPAIVSVFDVGEERDLAFIAMDFAEGKPLSSFVNADNLLPVFEVYRIVHDVAVALEYAHENNIVHRDIKPGNIIYNPSPYQIKITDFGIARLVDNSKTNTGEILGSPLYMSPEQLKGKKVNRAADIFSLGVTFYQLLSGFLPYAGDNLAALTYEIIHGKHKGVRTLRKDLPASASRITNQALQKDPSDRYETAAEMALVLKKAIRRDFASQAKKVGFI